jgi:hypothetical protein
MPGERLMMPPCLGGRWERRSDHRGRRAASEPERKVRQSNAGDAHRCVEEKSRRRRASNGPHGEHPEAPVAHETIIASAAAATSLR